MPTGTCLNWHGTYGFIEPEQDFPGIFVHCSDLAGTCEDLVPGDRVSYAVERAGKGKGRGGIKAIKAQVITKRGRTNASVTPKLEVLDSTSCILSWNLLKTALLHPGLHARSRE